VSRSTVRASTSDPVDARPAHSARAYLVEALQRLAVAEHLAEREPCNVIRAAYLRHERARVELLLAPAASDTLQ
jgi:hypothetical protein